MQRADHRLELLDRPVVVVGREETNRLVAPVVAQPARDERLVVDEGVHGQELHSGHAERRQVLDRRVAGKAAERPAIGLRHAGVELREALHVQLVDHAVGQRDARMRVLAPVERHVVHDRARDERRGVHARVEHGRVPRDGAGDLARVRIEQQLARVAAARPVNAKAVLDAVADVRHERRPDVALLRLHRDEATLEHQVDGGRDAAEDGELRAALHNVRAQPRPRAHTPTSLLSSRRRCLPGAGRGSAPQARRACPCRSAARARRAPRD